MAQEIVDFIRKAFNKPTGFIPLHEPKFIGNERKYVLDAIDSTFVSSVGEYVNKFETEMAKVANTKYAVACVNGTAALHIALICAGVKHDDEVLTQPLTFIATANAISYIGAKPLFVDIEPNSLSIDPEKLKKYLQQIVFFVNDIPHNKITKRKIAACVPMHTFGLVGQIKELIAVCNSFNIPVVEDAAESIGSKLQGKSTGSFGLLGTFSFNGNKTITCGGGGAIVTNSKKLAKLAKHLTTQAKKPHPYFFIHNYIGYNYRMPNLNAAMAVAQLEQLDMFLKNKRILAIQYQQFFESRPEIFLTEHPNTTSNYWLNAILFNNLNKRNSFLNLSNSQNVMVRPAWNLMHTLKMFKNCQRDNLKISKFIFDRLVNLPSSVRI